MTPSQNPEKADGRPAAKTKILSSLAVSLLIVATLFVFGPVTLYQGNTEELAVPLASLLKTLAGPALILLILIGLGGFLLRGKAHALYVSILFALGVLLWLQGNFLVWNYGLLDGRGIDWSKNAWRGWADGALWAGLLVVSGFLHKKVYRVAAWVSVAITAVILASLAITSFQNPETWAVGEKARRPLVPPEEIFKLSSRMNVIHLVLDGFESDVFSELLSGSPDFYSQALPGFTFYREALGTFPTTYMSVPAFLSGRVYNNEVPMRRFVLEVNRGKTVFNELYDRGYETHLVEAARFTKGCRRTQEYQIAVPYGGTERENLRSKSAQMLDLSLFRHAPHFLKRFIYNDQTWLVQRIIAPKGRLLNLEYFSHAAFMDDVIGHSSVKSEKPVYTYIHLMTSHFPMVVNADCAYAGKIPSSRENIKIQANCVFRQVIRFMEKLKAAGIYDSSLIIIQSDHGQGHEIAWRNPEGPGDGVDFIGDVGLPEIAGSSLSLLLVKLPRETAGFRVSEAQVSLTDIPATLGAALGLDMGLGGRAVFEVDPVETRERRFLYHEWGADDWKKSYFPRLDEFVVKGSVFDRNSWRLNRTYYPKRRRR